MRQSPVARAGGAAALVVVTFSALTGLFTLAPTLRPRAEPSSSATLTYHDLYGQPGAFDRISCVNASNCVAVGLEGYVAITSNGGQSFSVVRAGPPGSILQGVSCLSDGTCWAAGTLGGTSGFVIQSTNAGASWGSATPVSSASTLNGISCLSDTECVAVGQAAGAGAAFVTTNGSTWTATSVPSGTSLLNDVSCGSQNGGPYCTAAGQSSGSGGVSGTVIETTNLSSWSAVTLPSPSTDLLSVWCSPAAPTCLVGGYNGASATAFYTSSLTSYSTSALPGGPTALNDVSCAGGSTCVAVDPNGFVLVSSSGGSSFSLDPNAPAQIAGYLASTCTSGSSCILLGQLLSGIGVAELMSISSQGDSYSTVAIPSEISLYSISCVNSMFCVSVGDSSTFPVALITNNAGGSFTTETPGNVPGDLLGIYCASTSSCVAVGDVLGGGGLAYVSNNGGITWSQASVPSGLAGLTAVVCPSSSTCLATDAGGSVAMSTNGGSSFTTVSTPLSSSGALYSISCPTPSACFASGYQLGGSGQNGAVLASFNGGASWTSLSVNAASTRLYAISCTGSGPYTCFVGGQGSNSVGVIYQLTYNSGSVSWSSEALPQGSTGIEGLSCVSSTACQAADASGNLYDTTDGVTWQREGGPYSVETMADVSCVSATQCFAVGASTVLGTQPVVQRVSPSSGPLSGGNTVLISGGGFSGASSVYFGTNPASSFSVVSDNLIEATVPQGSSPGVVDVTVAVSGVGSSPVVSTDGYLYVASGQFTAVSPVRILDTRPGATDPPTYAGQTLGPGAELNLPVVNAANDGVPSNAIAVVATVTAVGPTSTGYLTIWPTGLAMPLASSVNFLAGQSAVANLVEIPLGKNGSVSIYNAFGFTNVLFDVEGYVSSSGSYYHPMSPVRLADTRSGSGYQGQGQYLSPGSSITVQVAGLNGVAQGASAAVLNVTVTNTTNNGGYVVVYPTGSSLPDTSVLNFDAGMTVAARVQIALGQGGSVTVAVFNSSADVIVDLNGWYGTASSGGYSFTPVSPVRIVDTRSYPSNPFQLAGSPMTPGTIRSFQVGGYGSDQVPTSAVAFVGNVTVTDTAANGGYLTLFPAGSSVPATSDINWFAGQIVSNMAVVELGNNSVSAQAEVSATDMVVDVSGYFS